MLVCVLCVRRAETVDMTILDLIKLIQRNLKLIIALPVLFAALAIAWSLFTQASYTATASFITNGDLAFAQGLANKEAATYSNSGIQISCSSQSSTKQIMISATGEDSSLCVESANAVAEKAVEEYKSISSSIIATVTKATSAARDTPSSIKMVLVALALGLFIAICIVALIDMIKAPIKSREDTESVSELLVLGTVPSSDGGDRLLANLQFCCEVRPLSVAVVPVGVATTAPATARELAGAFERSDVRVKLVKGSPHAKKFQVTVPPDAAIIVSCESLSAGMGAAYIAHNADATVLCVSEWTDSKRQLLSTLRELELAKANIAGIAYLPEEKKAGKSRFLKKSDVEE